MSNASRRLSLRRQSIHNRKHDALFVENFLSNRGVTIDDVELAFTLLSKDGHKITREDIKEFADKYFKGKLKMVISFYKIK